MDYDYDQFVEAFIYLDELRKSGVTNMYGARSYIASDLGHDNRTSQLLLTLWMRTYDPEKSPETRAKELEDVS